MFCNGLCYPSLVAVGEVHSVGLRETAGRAFVPSGSEQMGRGTTGLEAGEMLSIIGTLLHFYAKYLCW